MASELGYAGTLIVGAEVQYCKDVELEMDAEQVDDTTRNNDGWKSTAAGLRNWVVTFTMVKHGGDTMYNTLRTAFETGAALSGVSVTDEQGDSVSGSCKVHRFSRREPLSGVVTVDVTLTGQGKPTFT